MKKINLATILALVLMTTGSSLAQTRQPGGQRFEMGQLIDMEKKVILDTLTALNNDQKAIIEIIYADYKESMAKLREEADGDFQAMRPKLVEIREEKEESMKQVLTEEQFKIYTALMEQRTRRRRGN